MWEKITQLIRVHTNFPKHKLGCYRNQIPSTSSDFVPFTLQFWPCMARVFVDLLCSLGLQCHLTVTVWVYHRTVTPAQRISLAGIILLPFGDLITASQVETINTEEYSLLSLLCCTCFWIEFIVVETEN